MRSLAAVLVLVLIWTAGLFAFADRARRAGPPDQVPVADGIVVLTGASDERIAAGLHLLEQGKARRMLVSGVNEAVRREELRQVQGAPARLYDCCVDLGYDALNTPGNAREIADWAHAKGFRKLIVVTSDYHMPRAILEIRAMFPEGQLFRYPVATPLLDNKKWWEDQRSTKLVVSEYMKYLYVLGRDFFLRLGDSAERAGEGGKEEAASPAGTR
ncbi:MAG: YdcF family protein [Caulobacteraceae bacterium]|nr:YdcF family protein [Caulobacteraceae bacterium]